MNIWDWLKTCKYCRREHKPIKQPDGLAPLWNDPGDGHPYNPWMPPFKVSELQSAYESDNR